MTSYEVVKRAIQNKNPPRLPVRFGAFSVDDTADVRYFGDNNLPAPIEGEGAQESVNPNNGYWLAANMTAGQVTLQGKVGDEVVGETTFFAFAGEAISIGNIYVDESYDENPGTCE